MNPTSMTFLKDPNQEMYKVYLLEVGECTVTVQYVHSGNQELIDLADVVFNNLPASSQCKSLLPVEILGFFMCKTASQS